MHEIVVLYLLSMLSSASSLLYVLQAIINIVRHVLVKVLDPELKHFISLHDFLSVYGKLVVDPFDGDYQVLQMHQF